MSQKISKQPRVRLARIKLLLCDVDGVLTDGTVWMGGGIEMKRFDIRDGLGMKILQHNGIKVGWVSRRPSSATQQRAEDLKIDFLAQHDGGKVEVVESLLQETGLSWPEVCFIGDDIVDIGVMKRAGFAVAVANAVAPAKRVAHYVAKASGGHGAVREVVEMILKAQRKWERIVAEYEI